MFFKSNRRPIIESLEPRSLLASISISDASAVEGNSAIQYIDDFVAPQSGGLQYARGLDYGPDGNIYISVETIDDPTGFVNRYDAQTGRFIDRFASHPTLTGAKDVEFGPDGNLYVPNNFGDTVYRFNGITGEFIDVFVTTGSGGVDVPRSLKFGPDGNGDGISDAYVTSAATDNVLRYDGVSGAFIDAFVPSGSGGLNDPTALVFGPDGNLYVASGAHSNFYNSILQYNGTTGVFMDVFVAAGSAGLTLAPTAGVIFGPDADSDGMQDLYVSNGEIDEVLIYSGANGSFLQKFIPPGLGGLDDPKGLLFDNEGNLLVISNSDASAGHYSDVVRRYGPSSLARLNVSLSGPNESPVTVEFNTNASSALAAEDYIATTGTVTFAPGETTRTILVRTVDDGTMEPNESFSVILSNPVGAVLADNMGVATVFDDDAKFYVVNDAAADSTFRYDAAGASGVSSTLATGNTAPRGAASTAAGDRVWVVDANKTVYVYDAGGTLLGSWTAGSLPRNAQVQGIATDGTNIWIVDAAQDKVFRYANAASRLSGSQNAASFSLNKNNKNPKGITTDGTHLWVVEDSTTDKVFKYTLSGSLVGSWTINSGGGSPTGITLDLANNSDLWIVDSATDRVYQYTTAGGVTAAARISGSLSHATSFPLAAGNLNPQGIADPPTGAPTAFLGSPVPTKLSAGAIAALARAATVPGATTRPPQKLPVVQQPRDSRPVLSPQVPLVAIDTAMTELFDADELPNMPASYAPLAIGAVLDDLAAAMR